jgi:uncharacterized protein
MMPMEVLTGFAIAMIVGLTGMGGGPLSVPILTLVLGLPAAEAVGTSLLFVMVTKLTATPIYFVRKQIDFSVMRRLALGGVPGVILGSLLLSKLNTAALQPMVLSVIGATIALLAAVSLWKLRHKTAQRPAVARLYLLPWLAFPIGLELGFSAAGAGALGSLIMMYCTTIPANQIVGTDLLFGLTLATVGGGLHLAAGHVNPGLLLNLCIGGVAGATTGALIGTRLPARPLRLALSTLLVYLGGQLFWKGFQGFVR